jgi:HD-like signal output (HDOD) protein/CheY-like chemotaxis protein
MKNILFVDDEINILNGLRRMLHSKKKEWHMHFVLTGQEALDLLESERFDAIVSDMRMPCMNGAQLLSKVMEKYPRITRIALSGYSDTQMILESIKATHLFISKPTDFETLSCAIERSLSIQEILDDSKLCDFISGIHSLPCVPEIYNKLVEELNSSDASIDSVGKIIEQDMSMSVKLLQIVNSAYFGLAREIDSPSQAAAHLGLDIIKSLVLSIKVFESFEDESNSGKLTRIYSRSQAAAQLATVIGKAEGFDKRECNQLLISGLLQDVGELVICKYFPKALQEELAINSDKDIALQLEHQRKVLGVSHEQIGAYILHLWGIPFPIVECVAFHQGGVAEIDLDNLKLSDIIYIANLIVSKNKGEPLPENIVVNEGLQAYFEQWSSVQ